MLKECIQQDTVSRIGFGLVTIDTISPPSKSNEVLISVLGPSPLNNQGC